MLQIANYSIIIYQELLYFVIVFILTGTLPLLVMLMSYLTIILIIYRRSKQLKTTSHDNMNTSNLGVISRAKIQTVKVTGVLVLGFVLCWTPYNVMALWLVRMLDTVFAYNALPLW